MNKYATNVSLSSTEKQEKSFYFTLLIFTEQFVINDKVSASLSRSWSNQDTEDNPKTPIQMQKQKEARKSRKQEIQTKKFKMPSRKKKLVKNAHA